MQCETEGIDHGRHHHIGINAVPRVHTFDPTTNPLGASNVDDLGLNALVLSTCKTLIHLLHPSLQSSVMITIHGHTMHDPQ